MKENTERFRNRTHSKEIRASEEFYTEKNYFDRLPTELIISIFARILDAKCLCICYSVSKSFAAHVLQTRFVSVEIPYAVGEYGRVPVWPPGVINFLKKLCFVESATIQFSLRNPSPSSSKQISNPLVWWKSDSFGFIFVRVASSDDDITSTNATCKFPKEKHGSISSIVKHLRDFKLRFRYVEELVVVLPNLKYISAVDSMKQGNIVLEEEGIDSMKKEKSLDGREFCRKLWIAPKVKLSPSGYVPKNVALILTREIGACDGLIAENLLEETEYGELAITMMKNRAIYESHDSSAGTIADVPYMSFMFMPGPVFIQVHRFLSV